MRAEDYRKLLRSQRSRWVDIRDGASVCVRRPPVMDYARLSGGITVDLIRDYAIDWRGVTGQWLVGAAGGSDPVPFDAGLWGDYVADEPADITAVAEALLDMVRERTDALEATEKN